VTAGNTILNERADHWVMKDANQFGTKNMGAFEISGGKSAAWRDYLYLDAELIAYGRKLAGS
jgi:limonene-1,2-epoxide hydrolase